MSRTLFLSFARLYAALAAAVLAGVVLIYLVADFGDWVRLYVNHPVSEVLALYVAKAQVATLQFAPAALLLAGGAAATVVRRRGEWTALQALGFSRWSLVGPVLACTLVAVAGLWLFDDRFVTAAGARVDDLMVHSFGRVGDTSLFYAPKRWFRVGAHVLNVRGSSSGTALDDVTVFELGPRFELVRRLDARRAVSVGGDRWRLEDVTERAFAGASTAPRRSATEEVRLAGSSPDTFRIEVGRPELMRFGELVEQQALRARVGLPEGRFWYALHARLAWPVQGLAGALLAVVLALRPGRRGALSLALVEGAAIALVLFTLTLAGKAMVLGQHLPAWGAAWGPVVALALATALVWLGSERRLPGQR